nr:hypothetical protein [Neobacillus sp. Marseille-Q6967]
MSTQDPNKRYSFEFDEQGTNEVSEQIMNSYNSGVIDMEAGKGNNETYQFTEGVQGTEG